MIKTLEQSLSHFALEEMRRSNPFSTFLQANGSKKDEIEKALREKIIITPEQQQKELLVLLR